MSRTSKLTQEQIARIRVVARARAAIPLTVALAREFGVPSRTVQYWLTDEWKQIRAERARAQRDARTQREAR